MLAESASVVIYENFCVVLFYAVNFYFYSRLVYSFSNVTTLGLKSYASPQSESKPHSVQECL